VQPDIAGAGLGTGGLPEADGLARQPVIQLARFGPVLSDSLSDVEHLRSEYEEQDYLLLPQFFEPEFLRLVQQELATQGFSEVTAGGIARSLHLEYGSLLCKLELLTNDRRLVEAIRRITGCGPIGCFSGRVYRLPPEPGYGSGWHSDTAFDRMIALSVNLSLRPYTGGLLQIRRRNSPDHIREIANNGPGDAILMRIGPDLHHRVTAVEGDEPRTAFNGWFRSQPDYRTLLTERMRGISATEPGSD
jgi:hypothetical protein